MKNVWKCHFGFLCSKEIEPENDASAAENQLSSPIVRTDKIWYRHYEKTLKRLQ
jgi:hypothetical protein